MNGDVRSTGYLDDGTLEMILCGAQELAFPSHYEGFGLPALEATRAGVPVACSDKASLPEVAGAAAVFSDPYSVEDISRKILQAALDAELREGLRQRGFENLKWFSRGKTAPETVVIYEQVHQVRKGSWE